VRAVFNFFGLLEQALTCESGERALHVSLLATARITDLIDSKRSAPDKKCEAHTGARTQAQRLTCLWVALGWHTALLTIDVLSCH